MPGTCFVYCKFSYRGKQTMFLGNRLLCTHLNLATTTKTKQYKMLCSWMFSKSILVLMMWE